jgi:hypothetical protein
VDAIELLIFGREPSKKKSGQRAEKKKKKVDDMAENNRGSGLRSATQLVTDGDPSCTKIFDAFMYCMSTCASVARRAVPAPTLRADATCPR